MDRNEKFIQKLREKEQKTVHEIILAIKAGKTDKYHVKKLSGYDKVYRIKHGSIRVIYELTDYEPEILYVGYRNENTYKEF